MTRSRSCQAMTCSAPTWPRRSSPLSAWHVALAAFLGGCCSVVFQAASYSRCSQSHMCFFAPSNDIFPMQTVDSTAFAVLVKKTQKSHTRADFLLHCLSSGGVGPLLSPPPPVPPTRGRCFLTASAPGFQPVPPAPAKHCISISYS